VSGIAGRLAASGSEATKLLEEGGWKPGANGIREKDGVKLHAVYQTSINPPRQETEEIVKQACEKAGISIEIKSIVASVYVSSDVSNPDTYRHFSTDLQMFTTTMQQPDPGVFVRQFLSSEIASKANKYQGRNVVRWQSPEYDKLFARSETEIDPVERAAMFIALNDILIKDVAVIPVMTRPAVSAVANGLHAPLSGWDTNT
jgi:peptide/nickel transport system substrate-binding protein